MKTSRLKNAILYLLLSCTACNGQVKINTPDKVVGKTQSFTSQNSKLTKTQGTTEHQNVRCSIQDKEGNLWFGTTGEGVYRYDGKLFTQFTEKDGLSSNAVWAVLEDRAGNIWFGTDDGLSRYDGKSILKVPIAVSNPNGFGIARLPSGKIRVWSIFQDKSGILWFGTSEDLYCYNGKTFSRFLDKSNLSNSQNLSLKWIQCFLEADSGTIWMGSGPVAMEGVIQFNGKSITGSKPNGDGWIRTMVEDQNKKLWFGGRGRGNFTYDGKEFDNYTQKTSIGNPVVADKAGNLWFSGEEKTATVESTGGIWRYDGKTFKNYNTNDGMSKYFVCSMLADNRGNIWIGTRNCGLYRFDGKTFTAFSQ